MTEVKQVQNLIYIVALALVKAIGTSMFTVHTIFILEQEIALTMITSKFQDKLDIILNY